MAKTYEDVWAQADDAYKARFGGDKAKAIQAMKDWNTKQAAKKDVANTKNTATHGPGSIGKTLRDPDAKTYHKASGPTGVVSHVKGEASVFGTDGKVQPLDAVNLAGKPNMNLRKDPTMTPNNERISSMVRSTNIGGKHTPSKGAQGGAGSSSKLYQSATTHTDASGNMITNQKGIPGKTRDRAIIGGPSKAHSDAISQSDQAGTWKSTVKDMDTTDSGQKLMQEEGEYDARMRKRNKKETIAGLESKKDFRKAKREGTLKKGDKAAAKDSIRFNKQVGKMEKTADKTALKDAKKKVRGGMAPDTAGAQGLGYGKNYEKLLASRSYKKYLKNDGGWDTWKGMKESGDPRATNFGKYARAAKKKIRKGISPSTNKPFES